MNSFGFVQSEVPQYKLTRTFSNSNPSLELSKSNSITSNEPPMNIATNNIINNNNNNNNGVHVEYEVSVPIVQSFRHTPYHSLWNLNQWFVNYLCFFFKYFFIYFKISFNQTIDCIHGKYEQKTKENVT